jgi:hypothetical protein
MVALFSLQAFDFRLSERTPLVGSFAELRLRPVSLAARRRL